jgi:hypothetical protein
MPLPELHIRVRIIDPEHPHYRETGVFTGEIVQFTHWQGKMAKIALDACQHGVTACYVSPGQIGEDELR